MNKDMAYLLGALRDGSVFYDKASRNYKIIWYENNVNWLVNSIASRIKHVFGKEPRIEEYKKGYHRVLVSSQKIYNVFVNDFGFVAPQEKWNTPKSIKKAAKEIIAGYVAGFFDAEGDVNPVKYMIGISQKNLESLEFIKNWLHKNNIQSSRIFVADKKSGTRRFYITSKENFKLFANLVKIEHPTKIKKMDNLLQ